MGRDRSGVLQLAMLMWAVRRAGMRLHLPRPRMTPKMRHLLRRMVPGLLGAGVTQLNLAVDSVIVTLLPPGSASLLYYADRVNQLPLGVIGTAVGTALLPLLSRQARSGLSDEARHTLSRALEVSLALTLPAALALAVAGQPIMLVLFGRGAFTAEAATLSAQSLACYAFGLPAFVAIKVLIPAFFAHGDTSTPVRVGFAAIALNLVLNLLFMVPLQHMGPALATSLSAMFNVITLGVMLTRQGRLVVDRRLQQRLLRMAGAALAMAAALVTVQHYLSIRVEMTAGLRWAALVLLVSAGLAAYAVAGQLLGAFDARLLMMAVRRRRRRAA